MCSAAIENMAMVTITCTRLHSPADRSAASRKRWRARSRTVNESSIVRRFRRGSPIFRKPMSRKGAPSQRGFAASVNGAKAAIETSLPIDRSSCSRGVWVRPRADSASATSRVWSVAGLSCISTSPLLRRTT